MSRGERGQNTIPGYLSSQETRWVSQNIGVPKTHSHRPVSHHLIHQTLGVVITLLDMCHILVTENEDREAEEQYIKEALANCGYPDWTIIKVKDQMKTSKEDT